MAKVEEFGELSQICGFDLSNNVIKTNHIDFNNADYVINDAVYSENLEEIIENLLSKKTRQIITEYKCHNCGGSLNIPNDKHIMTCPYCNSVYAYGLQMVNDKG